MTSSVRPVRPRPSSTQRRAAEIAAAADLQPQLKREAAERRAARARAEVKAAAAQERPDATSSRVVI
jgi:hypothetical protein